MYTSRIAAPRSCPGGFPCFFPCFPLPFGLGLVPLWLGLVLFSPPGLPAETTPARAERIPWLDPLPGPRLAGPAVRLRPVRLKSGAFAGAGDLARNLAAACAARPSAETVHVLVQLDRTPDPVARETLERAGVRLLGYVPEQAYFAAVRADADLAAAAGAGLRWVGAVYPEDKLSETLRAGTPGRWAVEPDGRVRLRVWPFEEVRLSRLRAVLEQAGFEVGRESPDTGELEVRTVPEAVPVLASLDEVRWVEEVPPPIALFNDGLRTNLQVHEVEAPPYGLSGAGVVVGIWDGGWVDIDHPDLAGRVVRGEASVPQPRNRHATHVAGTLAGSGAASESAGGLPRQWRGVAPGASLVSYDVNTGPLIEEHRFARENHNAVISQNSWGITVSEFFGNCHLLGDYAGDAPNYDRLVTGLYGAPYHVVFAVGNARTRGVLNDCPAPEGYRTVGVPATAKNVLSVGAIHSDDNSMTAFSAWGPTDDGRVKPELVAPGDEVGGDGGIKSSVPDGPYDVLVGTSMAAPAVSGATALLIEDYRNHFNGQTPLPALVKGLLVHTAEDLNDATDWYQPGPDYASGYGRVRVRAAVDQLRGGGWLLGRVGPGENAVYTLNVPPGTARVKLTLVWDDAPALQNAAVALVNDLDLVVTDPGGRRHYPWTLDPGNPGAPATRDRPDHVNNLEQVCVDQAPEPGEWTVAVSAYQLPLGAAQTFALVFSPLGLPNAPLLSLEPAPADDTAGGNGNGFLDPGEEIEERLVLRHTDGPGASNLTVRLTTDSPWVQLLEAESAYPDLPPGGSGTNLTRLAYRVSKHAPCGEVLRFEHVTALDGVRYTNRFTRVVGRLEVTNVATAVFASADTPNPLPDLAATVSTLPVGQTGTVLEVKTAVRLDHTWLDDLEVKLRAPDGASAVLIPSLLHFGQNLGRGECGPAVEWTRFDDAAEHSLNEGAAPFVGTFRPFESLAGLTNRPLAGDWQLVVTDTSAEDVGTLLCWELEVRYAQAGYVCEFFNRTPLAANASPVVWFEHPTWLDLPGSDPDADPLTFELLDPPAHGTLADLDPATGRVRYTPAAGYSGPDSFTYRVSDGYALSAVGTISLEVQPPSADLALSLALSPPVLRHDQPFDLILTMTNPGPNHAPGVLLTATLPDEVEVLAASSSHGTVSVQRHVLVAAVGTLAEGAQASVRLTLRASAPGNFPLSASVSSGIRELNFADNRSDSTLPVLPTADLALRAQSVAVPVPAGRPLEVVLSVTNSGPYPAGNVQITAALPAQTTLVSATPSRGEWRLEGNTFHAGLGSLPAGEVAQVQLLFIPEMPGAWSLAAAVTADEPDPDPGNNEATAAAEVRPVTDLALNWPPLAGPVALGGSFTNLLEVANRSAVPASAVRVRLEFGSGQTLAAVRPSVGEVVSGEAGMEWAVEALAPGAEARLELVFRADATGWLTNRATASAFEFDAAPEDNTTSAAIEVRPAADLALDFVAPPERVIPARAARYELVVTNHGPAAATAVTLTHPVPVGLTVRALTASQGTVRLESEQVIGELGELAPGAAATVAVEFEAAAPGPVTGRATVRAFEVDPAPGDNEREWVLAVEPPSDLSVALAVEPAAVMLTRETGLSFVLTNAGPYTATGVRAALTLPEGLGVLEAAASQGTVEDGPGGPLFRLGELPVGATATGQVRLVVRQVGDFVIRVSASADQPELNPADNEAESAVTGLPAVDLAVGQSFPALPLVPGHEFPLAITVTNRGPLTATGVRFSSVLPENLELLAVEGLDEGCEVESGLLSCELNELAAGATATVTLILRAPAPALFTNRVTVLAEEPELVPEDNVSELAGAIVPDADLSLTCASDLETPAVGQRFRVTATARNRGPYPATAVVLRALLPPAASLLNVNLAQGTWERQGGEVVVSLGDLAVDGAVPVEFELQPAQSGLLALGLSLAAAEPDLVPADNTCALTLPVPATALLAVAVQPASLLASPGFPFQLRVTVTNRGPETARQVEVSGAAPAGLEFRLASSDLGVWQPQPGGWVWRIEELPPGVSDMLTTEWLPLQLGDFVHEVHATAAEADPDLTDNVVQTPIAVRPAANLTLHLDAPPASLRRDTPTTYTFRLENQGPEPATQVVLAHPLPAQFELGETVADTGTVEVVGTQLLWRLGELPADATALLQLTVTPRAGGHVRLAASVTAVENDLDPADNAVEAGVEVLELADLAVRLAAEPENPLWSQAVRLEVAVTNRGPHAAAGLVLTHALPPDAELLSLETQPPAEVHTNGSDLVLAFGPLEAEAQAVATVAVRFMTAGSHTVSARAEAASLDETPADNQAELALEVLPAADLRLTKTALTQPALRDLPLRYRLVLSNAGLIPATAVRLTDPLPPDTELLELAADPGTAALSEGAVVYEPGEIPPGGLATLDLALRPLAVGSLTNVATVVMAEPDPRPEDNTAAAVSEIRLGADLTLALRTPPSPVVLGGPFTARVVVTNHGPHAATQVRITGTIPAGTRLTELDAGPGSLEITPAHWTVRLEELAPGVGTAMVLTFVPDVEGPVPLEAGVEAAELDLNPADNHAAANLQARPAADVQLVLLTDADALVARRELGLLLAVTNHGPHAATGVRIAYQQPPGTELTRLEPSAGEWLQTAGGFAAEFESLPPGALVWAEFAVRAAAPGPYTHVAELTASTFDPTPDDHRAEVRVNVFEEADLLVTHGPAPSALLLSNQFQVTVVVTNRGPITAPRVQMLVAFSLNADLLDAEFVGGDAVLAPPGVVCNMGDMPPGGSAVLTVLVRPNRVGTLVSQAAVRSPAANPDNPALLNRLEIPVYDRPWLEGRREGNRLTLVWPALAADYDLEFTENLAGNVWQPVPNPKLILGAEVQVNVKLSNPARFYRLRKPGP
jgi:uncharacterized repeat protein (TIGR01451 family)